jgi:hypothetical protein
MAGLSNKMILFLHLECGEMGGEIDGQNQLSFGNGGFMHWLTGSLCSAGGGSCVLTLMNGVILRITFCCRDFLDFLSPSILNFSDLAA